MVQALVICLLVAFISSPARAADVLSLDASNASGIESGRRLVTNQKYLTFTTETGNQVSIDCGNFINPNSVHIKVFPLFETNIFITRDKCEKKMDELARDLLDQSIERIEVSLGPLDHFGKPAPQSADTIFVDTKRPTPTQEAYAAP